MRQWQSYHRLIDAVLEWDPNDALARAGEKLTIAVDAGHALHAADLEWAVGRKSITLPSIAADRARVLSAVGG
jgi:hypothetical protein